ncbi:MAG TPA: carboxymuconolactone decarboxylase family protein, partial [Lacipirellula sp.]
MAIPQTYVKFKREQPKLVEAYEALGEACREAGPLDPRTVALVKLAIALGAGSEGGSHSAVRKAMQAGCTPQEL